MGIDCEGATVKGHEGTFRTNGHVVLYLDRKDKGWVTRGNTFVKTHGIVHLRFIRFTPCKFYLKGKNANKEKMHSQATYTTPIRMSGAGTQTSGF